MIFSDLRRGEYTYSYVETHDLKPDQVRKLYGGELITDRSFKPGCGWIIERITKGELYIRWTMSGKARWHMSMTDLAVMFPNLKKKDAL